MNVNPDDGWHNPRVLSIFAVIFLCGLVSGAAAMNFYVHSMIVRPSAVPTLQRLQNELNMTPAQRQAVIRELDEYAKYYQNIEEQRMSVAEQGKRNILQVLSPEQQKRFSQIFQFPSPAPCASSETEKTAAR